MDYVCLKVQPNGNIIVVPEPEIADTTTMVRVFSEGFSEDTPLPEGAEVKKELDTLEKKFNRKYRG